MANLWSGRFNSEPDPTAFQFGSSFRFDKRLFEDDVAGSLAWVEALAGVGVFNNAEAERVAAALNDILERGRREPSFIDGQDEDVHAFVERQLVERVGGPRQASSHRSFAQRTGVARSAPVSQATDTAASTKGRGGDRSAGEKGGGGGRRDHAVVHASSSGDARSGRALFPRARFGAPPRLRAIELGGSGS